MKRTLSGELKPSTPPVITGADTEENLAEDTQASGDVPPPGTPVMRTPEADDGTEINWQALNWLPDDLPDADALLQMMPHTPPIERQRLPQAALQESVEENEDGGEDSGEDDWCPFEESFRHFLDPACEAARFTLDDTDIATPSPAQRKALAQGIGRNTSLHTLALLDIRCKGLLAAVAEGMASNQGIRTLNLGDTTGHGDSTGCGGSVSCPAGSGVLLAQILATNSRLTRLDISGCNNLKAKDYLDVFTALKDNDTLEYLHANRHRTDALQIGAGDIDMLAVNRGLKMIGLPWGALTHEAFAAFGKVLQAHANLFTLDLGTFTTDGLLACALGDALKHGTRITTIAINCLALDDWHALNPDDTPHRKARIATVFRAIAQCPGLKSVQISNLLYFDCLLDLLRAHPGISQLVLRYPEMIAVEQIEEGLQQLAGYMQASNQISFFSFEQPVRSPLQSVSFVKELYTLAIDNLLTSAQTPSAGMGMSVMLGVQRNEPQALPELPLDVTMQLAEAVVQNLTPADTQAVFGAVTPYAEVPQPVPDALRFADIRQS